MIFKREFYSSRRLKNFFIFIFIFWIIFSQPLFAWNDCPFGKINDQFPGSCSRYLDTNQDNICDHSQPEPSTNSFYPQANSNKELKLNFFLFWQIFILIFLYGLSRYLVKIKKISLWRQRQLWNLILLLSFLITALTGMIIVLRFSSAFVYFWHQEAGIIFILVAIFHSLWHLSYFKNFFKVKK